jgi:RES domain-containing protein
MIVWRISAYADLSGEGGRLFEGRWHTAGHPIIYCAETPAGAMLEILAHMKNERLPETVQFLKIDVPYAAFNAAPMINNLDLSREYGDVWLREAPSLLLRVPSILAPQTFNILINPLHQDMAKVKIIETLDYLFDQRLN